MAIEARAEDDYGVASLELVFKTAAGKESVVPLGGGGGQLTASGLHTLFLEDLKVQPGDFVTYHARARDVGRGRQSAESRSDIFFLEVKPFEEEFTAAQSQAMGAGQGQETDVDTSRRRRRTSSPRPGSSTRARAGRSDARSAQDIRAVGRAQAGLKAKAEDLAGQISRASGDPRRRRVVPPGVAPGGDDPMARAVEAMGRAAAELDRVSTASALPFEMDALNQLLKAAAEIRRRQVMRQQAQGGGGNGNRQTPDLSTLFDQELRKQQQTNYETPTSSETKSDEKKADDPLDAIRELARRQEALSSQQRDLAKNRERLAEDELKRQLERLTREQNELRQQAEEMSKQLQQQSQQAASSRDQQGAQAKPSQSSQGGQQGQGGQSAGADSQKMRDISEEMRSAASDLRRQDPQQASARGDRALQQLRSLEQQMQGARPDERRRAMGDLQLEARQLADAERRLGNEAARTAPGAAGEDARRRLSAEQERLAARTDRLGESVKQLGKANADADGDERQAMDEAAKELDRQKIGERMRQAAEAMRQGAAQTVDPSGKPEEMARALDKVAERLGAATGTRDSETAKLSEQLGRTQELRDRMTKLQQSMDALARAGQPSQANAQGQPGQPGQQGQPSQSPAPSQGSSSPGGGQAGGTAQQGAGEGGRGAEVERLQREVNDQMREVQRLADDVRKQNPGMQKGNTTPEDWQRSVSAPGTESFKQDFAKWESLKKSLEVALERTESQLSDQLRARENRERLNAGRHDAVADSYRDLVDRYYQSLAAPRRPPR